MTQPIYLTGVTPSERKKKLSEWIERREAVNVLGDDEGYFLDILPRMMTFR
jgi:hypothetical protein